MSKQAGISPTITLDLDDPTPPFEQLRRQLVLLIDSKALQVGHRLPPIRHLASDLGLAPGTVARAYKELEESGYVETRRGGGTRVTRSAASSSWASAPEVACDAFIAACRGSGLDASSAANLVRRRWPTD